MTRVAVDFAWRRLALVAALSLGACTTPASPVPPSAATEASPSPTVAIASPEAVSPQPVSGLPGEPDPALTPGATNPDVTQATIGSTICVSGWTATVRPPSSYTTGLKQTQIGQYGYTDTNLADYEEDHLISLELGGAPRDPANLWPEPYTISLSDGRSVGARVKDQLENRLNDLVCSGEMPLAEAQADIATHWIATWFELSGQAPPPGGTAVPPAATPEVTAEPSAQATPETTTAPAAALSVRITKLTSPVARGGKATATAATAPGASCSIVVTYKSGPSSASGLGPKTASSTGVVSWTWTVGSRTTVGTWPVTVTCETDDEVASATKTFRVT